MTREEFEEKRDNFNSQRNDYLEKQNERDIVYKQKVKAGMLLVWINFFMCWDRLLSL